jgi:hypothetical protein
MKKLAVIIAVTLASITAQAELVLCTLLRIGATWTNEVPQDIRVQDFSINNSDDMRDWRLAKYIQPPAFPSLVNIRHNVGVSLEGKTIEEARAELRIQVARQAVVTPRQFKLALLGIGVTPDDVEAALATIEDDLLRVAAQIEWRDASVIRRDHPLISQIAPLLGGTDELLDELFLAALEIE